MQLVVLFDLDNTLVDRQRALADWAVAFRVRHGLPAGADAWLTALLADRATPAHFAYARERFRIASSAGALWDGYRADMARAVVCPPAVLSGIEELRGQGWRVGVVTNGATDIQHAKLRATGIAGRVDGVCVSEEVGTRKPHPSVFREALRRCGVSPTDDADTWMVGDNPRNDIHGGRGAGLRTVWVSGGRRWPPGLPAPDSQVTDASAAIAFLLALPVVGVTEVAGNLASP